VAGKTLPSMTVNPKSVTIGPAVLGSADKLTAAVMVVTVRKMGPVSNSVTAYRLRFFTTRKMGPVSNSVTAYRLRFFSNWSEIVIGCAVWPVEMVVAQEDRI
jgi:hypothetical protein